MIVKFTIGDWSKDGHNQADTFLYNSNYTVDQLREAYLVAVKKTGIDLREILCEYEECGIEESVLESLSAQINLPEGFREVEVGVIHFMKLLILFIKIGDPLVELEAIKIDGCFNEKFGKDQWGMGYGLFID